jgi:hypothetical protein
MGSIDRRHPAVRLRNATIVNIPGEIKLQFTPTLAADNEATILQQVSKVCLDRHNIKFTSAEDLAATPKKRVQ